MTIEIGENVHIVYRALYENSSRQHLIGTVRAVEGAICRIEGYVFVYDQKSHMFVKKPEKRISLINLSESGYIVNVIGKKVVLENVSYKYERDVGLIATDGLAFSLNINEFGIKS